MRASDINSRLRQLEARSLDDRDEVERVHEDLTKFLGEARGARVDLSIKSKWGKRLVALKEKIAEAPKKPAKGGKHKLDFDDEDAVLAEVCKDLDENPEDGSIEEERGLTSFGEGTVYAVKSGGAEYAVAESDDAAHDLAIAIVLQDLEEDPGMFNATFIQSHIDEKHLASELHSGVHSERYDYYQDLAERRPEEFWEEAERHGTTGDRDVGPDDEGEYPDPSDSDIEDLAEEATKKQLQDPIGYLEDIYGREDALKQAIKIGGIDEEAAAEEAVSADGAGHFLSSYDGNTMETPAGLVYWRTN